MEGLREINISTIAGSDITLLICSMT